ncbi:hypothetical protein [Sphingomonas sp. TDK1]|uniref:hypothetical protein n=1 Tax=Sphingomonas sp. TDK1 TaxID=453247 RepID=UPI0007D8CEE7|nr:hypothetical protein [Sphingomonas sp. TDK1]OAN66729.1 hypothetical protein A7X12_11595 [Sphingomonas sp. TDK1]
MRYEIKPDWKCGAERWTCSHPLRSLGAPEPEDLAHLAPAEAKLSRRARLAILTLAGLSSWALFATIGWLLLATVHRLMGY